MKDEKTSIFKKMKDEVDLLHILMQKEDTENEAAAVAFVDSMNRLMCCYIGSLLAFSIQSEVSQESEAILRAILKQVDKDGKADEIIAAIKKSKDNCVFDAVKAKIKQIGLAKGEKPDLPPPRFPQEEDGTPIGFGM